MHKFDDKASKILLNVLSHTIERLSMDPPTLDYPKSVNFFEKNAKSLISEMGNSIDTVFDQYKNTIEQSIISVDSPRNLAFIPAAPTKASMIFDLVVSAGSLCGVSWQEASGAVWAETKSYDGSLISLDCLRVLEAALLLEARMETYLHWSLQERSFVKRIPAR